VARRIGSKPSIIAPTQPFIACFVAATSLSHRCRTRSRRPAGSEYHAAALQSVESNLALAAHAEKWEWKEVEATGEDGANADRR